MKHKRPASPALLLLVHSAFLLHHRFLSCLPVLSTSPHRSCVCLSRSAPHPLHAKSIRPRDPSPSSSPSTHYFLSYHSLFLPIHIHHLHPPPLFFQQARVATATATSRFISYRQPSCLRLRHRLDPSFSLTAQPPSCLNLRLADNPEAKRPLAHRLGSNLLLSDHWRERANGFTSLQKLTLVPDLASRLTSWNIHQSRPTLAKDSLGIVPSISPLPEGTSPFPCSLH